MDFEFEINRLRADLAELRGMVGYLDSQLTRISEAQAATELAAPAATEEGGANDPSLDLAPDLPH